MSGARAYPAERAAGTLAEELDRQLEVLVERGFAAAAGVEPAAFRELGEPLRPLLAEVDATARVPFVLVASRSLVPPPRALEGVRRHGRPAVSALDDDDLARFEPIPSVEVPHAPLYLLADVDTGADLRNVTPDAALPLLEERGRSPLTVEEGIALVVQHPEAVAKGAGFSLLGSRCGDRRVTALWIGSGAPKLGWCWAGNPHTWLGSASCAGRLPPRRRPRPAP